MGTEIIGTISEMALAFINLIIDGLGSVVEIFYTAGVGEDPGSMTFVGVLLLMGIAITFAKYPIKFIQKLLNRG